MVPWNSNSLFNRNITFTELENFTKWQKQDMFLKLNSQYDLAAWPEVAHPSFGNAQTNYSLELSIINNIYSLTTSPDKMHTIMEGSEESLKFHGTLKNGKQSIFMLTEGKRKRGFRWHDTPLNQVSDMLNMKPQFSVICEWQCLILLLERCHILESPKSKYKVCIVWMELTTAIHRVNTKCIVYG